jgi:heat shock protein HslJ
MAVASIAVATAADAQSSRAARQKEEAAKEKLEAQRAAVSTREKDFPTRNSWALVRMNGKPVNGERPSFTLDKQFRVRGFGGCNTFSAVAYPLRQQTFAVGPIAMTRKGCDPALMASEKSFLTSLRTSQKWDLDNGDLVIKTQAGELRFQRVF